MSGEILFRSAIGGFNKKDVYDYITSQNIKVKEILFEKDKDIADFHQKLMDYEAENLRLKKELESLTSMSESPIADFASKISVLRTKSEELKTKIESDKEKYGKVCSALIDKSVALKNASAYKEKAEKYDMLTKLLTNSSSEKDILFESNEADVQEIISESGLADCIPCEDSCNTESDIIDLLVNELKAIESALDLTENK